MCFYYSDRDDRAVKNLSGVGVGVAQWLQVPRDAASDGEQERGGAGGRGLWWTWLCSGVLGEVQGSF